MILPAILFIWPLWSGSSLASSVRASAESNGGSPWGCVTVLVLLTTVPIGLFVGRTSPRRARNLVGRKLDILIGLFLGWGWLGFATDAKILLSPELSVVIPVAILLYDAFALIWVHRVSEVRRFWRHGARIWLWLVLPVEAAVLLALNSAVSEPGPLSDWEAFFLLAMAIVFPYLASRRRRTEGAIR
jgi:hypothetical protein